MTSGVRSSVERLADATRNGQLRPWLQSWLTLAQQSAFDVSAEISADRSEDKRM